MRVQGGLLSSLLLGGIYPNRKQAHLGVQGADSFGRLDHMHQAHYTLAIEVRDGYLFARASGVRNRDTVTAMIMEIVDAAVANRLSKILIDVTELEGRFRIMDSYFIVTEVFQKLRGKGIYLTAVVDEQVSSHPGRFLETVARNRGFNFRVFADQEDALEWLEL